MQSNAEANERVVCTILAAQLVGLRDRIDTGSGVDVLWQTADVLTELSVVVLELLRRCPGASPELKERCAAVVKGAAEIGRKIDGMACLGAQRHDLDRQMADCVVTALKGLAAGPGPMGTRVSPADLAALYVSDDQRKIHESVTGVLFANGLQIVPSDTGTHDRKGAAL